MKISCSEKKDCDPPNLEPCTKAGKATLHITDFDCVDGFCKYTTESETCEPPFLCINGTCQGAAGTENWGGSGG